MYTPLTKEQFNSALNSGFSPQEVIEMEKRRKSESEKTGISNTVSKIGSTVKDFAIKTLTSTNPLLKEALKTKTGQNVASKVIETGKQALGEALVPTVMPVAMTTGKDIPIVGTKAVAKGKPTPGEALGAGISAGLWAIPVEKVFAPILTPVGKFLGGVSERLAGAITGKGTAPIREILENPQAALQGLKGEDIQILTENAKQARNAVINLDRANIAEYSQALKDLPKRLGSLPKVMTDNLKTTIKVGGKTFILSKQGIKSNITEILRESGALVNRKNNFLDFTQSPLNEAEASQVKKVWNLINDWRDTTPEGINNLAVKIGSFKRNAPGNEYFNGLIGKIKEGTRNYIGKIIPEVGEMNAKYASSASTIEKLRDILDVPNNFQNPETLIDVAKKMQNFFSGNKQMEQALFKQNIPGGQELVSREAGRLVAQAPSRSSVSIGDTVKNLIQVAIPPKAIGELVAYTGLGAEKIRPFIKVLQDLAPAEREILFNIFKSPSE